MNKYRNKIEPFSYGSVQNGINLIAGDDKANVNKVQQILTYLTHNSRKTPFEMFQEFHWVNYLVQTRLYADDLFKLFNRYKSDPYLFTDVLALHFGKPEIANVLLHNDGAYDKADIQAKLLKIGGGIGIQKITTINGSRESLDIVKQWNMQLPPGYFIIVPSETGPLKALDENILSVKISELNDKKYPGADSFFAYLLAVSPESISELISS